MPWRAAAVSDGVAGKESALFADYAPMKARSEVLLPRAKEHWRVRPDVPIKELLSMLAALPERYRYTDRSSGLLDVVIRGIAA